MTAPSNSLPELRAAAHKIFDHALAECSIPRAFARSVAFSDSILDIDGDRYDLSTYSRVVLISIGKAGHTMPQALGRIAPIPLGGIVSCPVAPDDPVADLIYFAGGHPMPNEESLRAGEAILTLLHSLPPNSLVLFCISGGASAIAEFPLDPSLTLSDIIAVNRALVHSGAPIAKINAIRKHLSAIKGGRMAQAAAPATQISLLVSDVPDGSLDALASSPTMPDTSTVADCYAIAEGYNLMPQLPERVRAVFEQQVLKETPKRGDAAFARSQFVTLLSNQTAVNAAAELATSLGFFVAIDNSCDDWDYATAADHLLKELRGLGRQHDRVCLISGGEVTVKVESHSGTGGRNQQFALYCAEQIRGESIAVLSAGSDGVDGNSPAAGALIDGTTVARANYAGHDPSQALARFDAFPLLDAIGDALVTGPTGNNVRDLRLLLSY